MLRIFKGKIVCTGMRRVTLVAITIFFSLGSFAQKPDTLIRKLDSLNQRTDSLGGQINNTHPEAYNENTRITIPAFFTLEASNLKQAFTKPFHMSGKNWATVGKFAVAISALSLADRPIQRWALNLQMGALCRFKPTRQWDCLGRTSRKPPRLSGFAAVGYKPTPRLGPPFCRAR